MEHEQTTELQYEKPRVDDYGDLAELTAAEITGVELDVGFISDLFHHTPS